MAYFVIRDDGFVVVTDVWRDAEKALRNYYRYRKSVRKIFLEQYGKVEIMPVIDLTSIFREVSGIYTEEKIRELIHKKFQEIAEALANKLIEMTGAILKRKIERKRRPEIKVRRVWEYWFVYEILNKKCRKILHEEEYYDKDNTHIHMTIFRFKDKIGILRKEGFDNIYISIPQHRFKRPEEALKELLTHIEETYFEENRESAKKFIAETLSKALSIINNIKDREIPEDVKSNIATLLLAIA